VVRTGFNELLDTQSDLAVVRAASYGADGVRLIRELQTDVILLDVRIVACPVWTASPPPGSVTGTVA
jgi:DNA-binding NarL/FixJ family response regulator